MNKYNIVIEYLSVIEKLFNEIPHMLGRKFKFSAISGEYRKRELDPALELLQKAGVLHKVYHTSGQELPLRADIKSGLFYWHREARSSNAEVDYLIVNKGRIIPAEIKSGKEGTLRSMKVFKRFEKNRA